ncbi:hypothetical protein STENM36S_05134 [Streptomyces tendae]
MLYKDQGTLSVEFRAVHMSPILKLYVVGDEVVYEGSHDTSRCGPTRTAPPPPSRKGRHPTRGSCSTSSAADRCDPLEPLRR